MFAWSTRCGCPRTEVVVAPAGEATQALRELNADRDVVYAELDTCSTPSPRPTTLFPYQWGAQQHGPVQWRSTMRSTGGTDDADIDVHEAWD